LELPGLARSPLARLLTASLLGLAAVSPGVATAATTVASAGTTAAAPAPGSPVLVTSQTVPPAGFRMTAAAVEKIAARVLTVQATVRSHKGAYPGEYTKGPGQWQVSWFTPQGKEIAQVYIDDATGAVTQAWTGFQVAWSMARGYPGAFGRRVNALYVWIPMCVLFVLPFLPWRRRPSLLHLDLLVLLGFSISLAFFNHGNIGMSVPLVYPFLLYLLIRMLALALGRGRPREPLRLLVPASWLVIGVIFLVGFRIGLNVTNSNVIDVGYAGVIGADKLIHGHSLYGNWPSDNANGDTYGPVNYYAYVPARAIFGWSGLWDNLPAAHAAAILFDLLTLLGLYFLGRRIRGPTLGIVLAYAWVSYPFSLFVLSSNSNDSLVSALIVAALLVISSAPARGVAAALAAFTKFAPLALGPLFMRGLGDVPRRRSLVWYVVAFALTSVVVMLPVLDGNLSAFWHDSIEYQITRSAPFSIWGLWGGLKLEQDAVLGAAAMLALAVAVIPGKRTLVEVAALAAAVVIALQLSVSYWLYSYIVWFFPMVMLALLGSYPARAQRPVEAWSPSVPAPVAVPAPAP
jgi:hypothetical protein